MSLDQALRKHQLTRRLRAKAKKKESDQRKHQLEHSYRLQGVGGKWRRPGPCVAHDGNRCQYKSTTLPNRPLACRVKQLPLSKNHEYARRQNQQNAHVRVVPPSERECFIPRERRHPASREAVIRAKKTRIACPGLGSRIVGSGSGSCCGLIARRYRSVPEYLPGQKETRLPSHPPVRKPAGHLQPWQRRVWHVPRLPL